MLKPNTFSVPKSTISTASSSKKYYETDLDLTIKVPTKNGALMDDTAFLHSDRNANCNEGSVTSSSSRVINISVTKSQSLNFDTNLNKENAEDVKSNLLDKTNSKSNLVILLYFCFFTLNYVHPLFQKILLRVFFSVCSKCLEDSLMFSKVDMITLKQNHYLNHSNYFLDLSVFKKSFKLRKNLCSAEALIVTNIHHI